MMQFTAVYSDWQKHYNNWLQVNKDFNNEYYFAIVDYLAEKRIGYGNNDIYHNFWGMPQFTRDLSNKFTHQNKDDILRIEREIGDKYTGNVSYVSNALANAIKQLLYGDIVLPSSEYWYGKHYANFDDHSDRYRFSDSYYVDILTGLKQDGLKFQVVYFSNNNRRSDNHTIIYSNINDSFGYGLAKLRKLDATQRENAYQMLIWHRQAANLEPTHGALCPKFFVNCFNQWQEYMLSEDLVPHIDDRLFGSYKCRNITKKYRWQMKTV